MTPHAGTRSGFGESRTWLGDACAVALAALLAPVPIVGAVAVLGVLRFGDRHRPHSLVDDAAGIGRRLAVAMLPFVFLVADARAWLLAFGLALACGLLVRHGADWRRRRSGQLVAEPTVVVGAADDIAEYVRQFAVHSELGAWPVATIGDPEEQPTMLPHGPWEQLAAAVAEHRATHVVMVTPGREADVSDQWHAVRSAGCRVSVVAPFSEQLTSGAELVDVRGVPVLSLEPRRTQTGVRWWMKRTIDVSLAGAALAVLSPILLLVALVIRLDDGGPAVFRQIRVGRGGRLFTMYKFRSMVVGAEELRSQLADANEASGPFFKMADDPRITRIGRLLRRFSLDELPQLVNVVRGEMSLVGPRPCLPSEAADAPELFAQREPVLPGVTGLWQIAGRSWLPATEGARMDLAYVEHWNPLLDLRVLARTAVVALRNDRRPPIDARNEPIGFDRRRYAGSVVGDDLTPGDPVDVSIVVVTHESSAQIEACLESIASNHDAVSREVIVVDNASTDDTVAIIRERFPWVRVIGKRRRDGFATNSNIGVIASAGRHVLFLNPDARLRGGSLVGLIEHLDSNADVGVVGPSLVYPDGSPQPSARQFPTLVTGVVRRTPLRVLLPSVADGHLMEDAGDDVREVDWMLGGAIAARRSTLDYVGGFDDAYRLYCEDMDLCWRVREQGWKVQQQPAVVIEHELDEYTSRKFLTRRTIWHLRSAVRFVRLHGLGRPEPVIDLAPVHRRRLVEAAHRPLPIAV